MNDRLYFPYYSEMVNKKIDLMDVKQIYDRLIDDLSKKIFINRMIFSFTNDWEYIRKIITNLDIWQRIENYLLVENKEIYIYGAGVRGERVPFLCSKKIRWGGYIDEKKRGTQCNGLLVYDLEQYLVFHKDENIILITNLIDYKKIEEKLIERGIRRGSIIILEEYYQKIAENMYFDSDCIKKDKIRNKVFIDAGCFDGNDVKKFYKWMGNIHANSISFELDRHNYDICKENLKGYEQAAIYNLGLAEREKEFKIEMGNGVETSLSKYGNNIIKTIALDQVGRDLDIGYIKMDIEGTELDALKGAEMIIRKQHPILAVSLYHKREDIWKVPTLILKFCPDYRFYIRHYSLSIAETVLYAI